MREDRSRSAHRTGAGRPCESDVLSVYLEGGPRYRLGRRTYRFTAPAAILIAAGTIDDDLQEGRVEGIFALFRGRGLVARGGAGGRDKTRVSLGADRMVVPQLKALAPRDAEKLAALLAGIAEPGGAGLGARLDRVGLLLRAVGLYCEAPGRGGAGSGIPVQNTYTQTVVKLIENEVRVGVFAKHTGTCSMGNTEAGFFTPWGWQPSIPDQTGSLVWDLSQVQSGTISLTEAISGFVLEEWCTDYLI